MSSRPCHLPRILRVPRSDDPAAYVLVHVLPTGSAALDLKLIATEGESPYVGSVRQSRLENLRAKNYRGSEEEWAQILSHVLGQDSPSTSHASWSSGVEVTASIQGPADEDKEMVIALRKRIDTITQRLGSITLRQDDEQAIQLFDWTGISVARADALEQQIHSLTERYRVAEDTINKLNVQLEKLTQAKSQHEDQLISRFVQLLNEKKLKIRNQQRLLASAKVDRTKVSDVKTSASGSRYRRAEASRLSKRKATQAHDDDSESDYGFEKMEIDEARDQHLSEQDEATDEGRHSTPQPLENEEETATDEELSPPPRGVVKISKKEGEEAGKVPGRPVTAKPPSPPPRRELPFKRKTAAKSHTKLIATEENQKPAQLAEDAEETAGETDDDEL
ncbi:hypothetical protein VTN00DRAFT_952 [Thermoascus crustaceus]|uniref:uncharacterized protein n=1 Tax=Thermoascus crustaceus TaxID=5088 RepID=UPI0037438528